MWDGDQQASMGWLHTKIEYFGVVDRNSSSADDIMGFEPFLFQFQVRRWNPCFLLVSTIKKPIVGSNEGIGMLSDSSATTNCFKSWARKSVRWEPSCSKHIFLELKSWTQENRNHKHDRILRVNSSRPAYGRQVLVSFRGTVFRLWKCQTITIYERVWIW